MSSSEAETSAGDEEHMKSMAMAAATASDHQHRNMVAGTGKRKQQRSNWNSARRFWRSSHHSNSSTQGSASDQEMPDIGSSISFAEPAAQQSASSIKLSSRQSNTSNSNRHLRLPSRTVSSSGGRQKASSTESLLNMIRSFSSSGATASGSNVHRTPSTPSSPQMGSDYEASSSFPTPLSTPCSPGGSLEIIPSSVASAGGSNNASGTVDSNSIQVWLSVSRMAPLNVYHNVCVTEVIKDTVLIERWSWSTLRHRIGIVEGCPSAAVTAHPAVV